MGLLPRLAGRNEDNLVKTEATGHLTSGDQVAVVDWIERATHHAKPITLLWVESALPGQACGAR
jgi:hypothetical protein